MSAKPRRHYGAREGDAGNIHPASSASVRRRPEEAAEKKNRHTSGRNQPELRETRNINQSAGIKEEGRDQTIHAREWRW
jgi:hypothetical protein